MKLGSNRDINKDQLLEPGKAEDVTHDAHMKRTDKPVKEDHFAIQHLNSKMLAEKHNDKKNSHYIFNRRSWVNCLLFLVANKWEHYYLQSVVQ